MSEPTYRTTRDLHLSHPEGPHDGVLLLAKGTEVQSVAFLTMPSGNEVAGFVYGSGLYHAPADALEPTP